MLGNAQPTRQVPASRIGAIAGEVLDGRGEVEVAAAFERTVYLATRRGIVCIGSGIGAGPIHVEVDVTHHAAWARHGLVAGVAGQLGARAIELEGGLIIDAAAAAVWLPPPLPPFDRQRTGDGLAVLRAAASIAAPTAGLAPLVLGGGKADATARAAAPMIAAVEAGLPRVLATGAWTGDVTRALTLLVGLGPGLTPSGDDLIGGLMLALTATAHEALRDALWSEIEDELEALTIGLSAMHLSAAADGMAVERLHMAIDAILSGGRDGPAALANGLAGIGHTSGWDAAAGIALGLAAAIRVTA